MHFRRSLGFPGLSFPFKLPGPESFTLIAVWSKTNQRYRYVTAVIKGIQKYRSLFADSPVVVMGDLNPTFYGTAIIRRARTTPH